MSGRHARAHRPQARRPTPRGSRAPPQPRGDPAGPPNGTVPERHQDRNWESRLAGPSIPTLIPANSTATTGTDPAVGGTLVQERCRERRPMARRHLVRRGALAAACGTSAGEPPTTRSNGRSPATKRSRRRPSNQPGQSRSLHRPRTYGPGSPRSAMWATAGPAGTPSTSGTPTPAVGAAPGGCSRRRPNGSRLDCASARKASPSGPLRPTATSSWPTTTRRSSGCSRRGCGRSSANVPGCSCCNRPTMVGPGCWFAPGSRSEGWASTCCGGRCLRSATSSSSGGCCRASSGAPRASPAAGAEAPAKDGGPGRPKPMTTAQQVGRHHRDPPSPSGPRSRSVR